MGADHTAGLTYRMPWNKGKQAENSLQAQIRAATCDAYGYCLNSLPGGRASIYQFFADLMNARYGIQYDAAGYHGDRKADSQGPARLQRKDGIQQNRYQQ